MKLAFNALSEEQKKLYRLITITAFDPNKIQEQKVIRNHFRYLLLDNFSFFLQTTFSYELSTNIVLYDYQKQICDELQAIVENQDKGKPIKNLIINIPPRLGKTTIMKYFCAWSFLRNRQSNILYTSYSSTLVNQIGEEVKRIIDNPLLQNCFNTLKINKARSAKHHWSLSDYGGQMYSVTFGGAVTGHGAGISDSNKYGGVLVMDDPSKPEDMRTSSGRENANRIFENTISSRRNNPKTPMVLIMQRLHPDDLTGYLLTTQKERWNQLILPALDKNGKSICESILSASEMRKMIETPSRRKVFLSQYQQEPVEEGGNIIKSNWFNWYDPKSLIMTHFGIQQCFATIDTALKGNSNCDYTVISTWLIQSKRLYLVDIQRGQWENKKFREVFSNLSNTIWKKYDLTKVMIEDYAMGATFIQDAKDQYYSFKIEPIKRGTDKSKAFRLNCVRGLIEDGFVYLPSDNSLDNNKLKDTVQDFVTECEKFTDDDSHSNDDMVDTMIDALQELHNISKYF